jgi:hypothetical protein
MLTGLVLGQEYARVDNEETENIAGLGIPSRPPTDASKPGKGRQWLLTEPVTVAPLRLGTR